MEISCPECHTYLVTPTTPPDNAGYCEYRCQECGHYFVDRYITEDEEEEDAQL